MSDFYTAQRTRNLYDPNSREPFKLSRSKLDLSIECPRCFYLDRRLGVGRVPGFPFNLNSAVDHLLKSEFDIYRAEGSTHPIQDEYGIDAKPAQHEMLDTWRENFKGIQYLHVPTNFIMQGALDDLWQNSAGEYIVVDYKSTSKTKQITVLDEDWHSGYKRQMEVYQWLLRKNGLVVSNTGYFVYCNGRQDLPRFDKTLKFNVTLIPYTGNDEWVEGAIMRACAILQSDTVPSAHEKCDHCAYVAALEKHKVS